MRLLAEILIAPVFVDDESLGRIGPNQSLAYLRANIVMILNHVAKSA